MFSLNSAMMDIMKFMFFCILFLFFSNCKNNNTNQRDDIELEVKKHLFVPNTFREAQDVFLDSLYIDTPSEGTIVEVFCKTEGKLYVFDAIATMSKYNVELLVKGDSSFLLRKTEEYNQPLSIPNAKLESKSVDYLSFYKDSLLFFCKDGVQIEEKQNINEKQHELQELKKMLKVKNNYYR